jgi:predicted ATPase
MMITLVEALNFRCLRYVSRPLSPFQVLVGPNASGKTTFLDVIGFLGQLVSEGLEAAINDRSENFEDLVWRRGHQTESFALIAEPGKPTSLLPSNAVDERFELAVEAAIPSEHQEKLGENYNTVRYEVSLGIDSENFELGIFTERVLLKTACQTNRIQGDLFPRELDAPPTILVPKKPIGARIVISKVSGGNDNFYSEIDKDTSKGFKPSFKLGPRKSALGNLPEDESKFPVSTWLKSLLSEGVQKFVLNSLEIRKASPPGQRRGFKPNGSNLPWVIERLEKASPERFRDWIAHVKTAFPDIETVRTVERPDDKHRYLVLRYLGGLEVPSWMVSDGTLRLLALTLPAYLTDFRGIYLIEEPENGIYPRAIETVFQSLSSAYDAQILMATHSPVILSVADSKKVLCFAKTASGATDIVSGDEHPALKEWRGETNLSVLFAAGVLGA